MALPANALSQPWPRSMLLGRLFWFGIGMIVTLTYNQFTWKQSGPAETKGVSASENQDQDAELEQLNRLLDEMQGLRRDYKRIKASRDRVQKDFETCQQKCPQFQQ
mmetsp:Transcript_23068/g.33037  ORF Transcript_23068/g.33037 Transcript_23068/m.33037 type:complete len:106 (-) Transcript_23068:441-758(-)